MTGYAAAVAAIRQVPAVTQTMSFPCPRVPLVCWRIPLHAYQCPPGARYQITAPTLIVGVRNDRYGTNACDDYTASRIAGAKFIGSDTGGHARAGHNTGVIDAVPDLLTRIASDPSHDPQPD